MEPQPAPLDFVQNTALQNARNMLQGEEAKS